MSEDNGPAEIGTEALETEASRTTENVVSEIWAEMSDSIPESYKDKESAIERAIGGEIPDALPETIVDIKTSAASTEESTEHEVTSEPEITDKSSDSIGTMEDGGPASDEDSQINFYAGEEVFRVPRDAEIEIKVDGELQKISLKDFQSGISGQKAIAQKFSALDQERKTLESKMANWNQGEQEFRQQMENGKIVEALDGIFERAGMNTEAVMAQFFQQIAQPLEAYMKLTPEKQAIWAEQVKAEKNRLQYEKVRADNERMQAEQQQLQQVRQVQAQYGMDDATFADLYHKLGQEMEAGTLSKQDITAELVGQYSVLLQRETWAGEALRGVDAKLADDPSVVQEVLSALSSIGSKGQPITQQDVLDLVNKVYGRSAQAAKSQQVNEVLQKKGQTLPNETQHVPGKSHRGAAGERPRHFLERMNADFSAAKSAQDRRNMINNWKNKK